MKTRAVALAALCTWMMGCSCSEETGLDGSMGPDGSVGPDGSIDGGLDGSSGSDGSSPLTCRGFGEELCGGACVNTQVDPANCGACGDACGAGEVCYSNGCAAGCPAGLTECAGTCVDADSSNAHCGACGNACAAGEGCLAGSCVDAVPLGPPPARCIGGGPPIEIGGAGALCTGTLSRVTFTHGLCACDDIGAPELSSELVVDAFDSTAGPYAPGGLGGDVGANDRVGTTSTVEIFGNLETTSVDGLTIRGETTVHEELRVSGGVALEAALDVGADAFVGGAFSGSASATIGGTLHTPVACASVPGNVGVGACVSGPVTVPPPCRCDSSEIVPIAAIVAYYADSAHNDNDEIGLSPDALDAPGAPGRLDLPCGYYHLSGVHPGGATTIAVHGRTAIFIEGSIEIGSALTFALDPGSTLDVFVGGTIFATGAFRVGSPAYPAQSRMYVGGVCGGEGAACVGDGDCCSLDCGGGTCSGGGAPPPFSVNLTSNTDLSGLFYAPNGLFVSSSDLEMYGAIFADSYHSSSATIIHYDRAAASTEDECPGPEPMDGGVPPPDAGSGACTTGAQSCGVGLPECGAGEFCVAGCCVFFG